MARKKKTEPKEIPIKKRDVKKFTATEWAVQEGLDPALFLYWANQHMTKSEFDELKNKI